MKMTQTTLDFLFNKTENIFILSWNKKPSKPYFSSQKLTSSNVNYNFLNNILHIPFILQGEIKKSKKFEYETTYTNISFLKSLLQKSIRRKNHDIAVLSAINLIKLDQMQFLRRLSIIMVEDVLLIQDYPIVIWLMIGVSSKNIVLQEDQIQWLLCLVYHLCDIPYQDYYPKIEDNEKKIKELLPKLKKEEKDIVTSILIRAGYGGMKGDIEMLKNCAYLWCNRFLDKQKPWRNYFFKPIEDLSLFMRPLKKEEWILGAIDFHCFPKILEWIDYEDKEKVKELIWNFSSKINERIYLSRPLPNNFIKNNQEKWDNIKKQFFSICKYAIKNYASHKT